MKTTALHPVLFALLILAAGPAAAKDRYTEDFSSGKATGWEPNKRAYWQVVGQEKNKPVYRAHYPYATGVWPMTSTLATREDADLRFSVRVRNKGPYASHILARATADFSYEDKIGSSYGFGLATEACGRNSSFQVYKLTDGVYEALQPWTVSPAIRCHAQSNKLTVRLQGGHIQFSINGTLVFDGTDPLPLGAGRVGLMGFTQEFLGTDHDYDDIVVAAPGPALAP